MVYFFVGVYSRTAPAPYPIGEYLMIVAGISLIPAAALAAVGVAVGCSMLYAESVTMAIAGDQAGLLAYKMLVPRACRIPIQVVYETDHPFITYHIWFAQNWGGQPRILTRGAGATNTNRRLACGPMLANFQCRGSQGLSALDVFYGSCDEYPYNSTNEGGSGATIMEAPLWEQIVQGGKIQGFYSSERVLTGDKFAVVPLPVLLRLYTLKNGLWPFCLWDFSLP